MRTILVLYMTKELGFAQGRASLVYGAYTASIYFTPLGQRRLPPAPSQADRRERAAASASSVEARRDFVGRLALMFAIVAASVGFRTAYEQSGNTFSLWADTLADRRVGALTIPATWFQAVNPLLVFTLTPLLVLHWSKLEALGREGGTAKKMAFGALFTAGELHILPVGLGLFTQIAPGGVAATAVAIWCSAGFLGNLSSGFMGRLWSVVSPPVFMALCAGVCPGAAAILTPFREPVRRAERETQQAGADPR